MWNDQSDDAARAAADTEYVERVRRLITWYDRWRPALVALYAGLLIALVAAVVVFSEGLRQGPLWAAMGPGLAAGLAVGAFLGLTAIKLVHGLAAALFRGRRGDRLLVQYHDALQRTDRDG